MSFFNGGDAGAGFEAKKADVIQGATKEQADTAYRQTQEAIAAQQQFMQALQAQGGIQNQASVYNQLQGVAQGRGPNPAQAMLANATGANVANQAALMASQRGAGANVGMMARQAGQAGAGIQQNAAGQAALMQAQQSLGALGQMGGIAGQQVAQQAGATQAYNAATQGQQQNILNALNAQNTANVQMQSNANTTNAQMAAERMKAQGQMLGGVLGAAGQIGAAYLTGGAAPLAAAALKAAQAGGQTGQGKAIAGPPTQETASALGWAHGGQVPRMAAGGAVPAQQGSGPRSSFGQLLHGMAKGGPVIGEQLAAAGMKVPGTAKVAGDSLKNDTVDAKLSPGEIVLPRTVVNSPNAPDKAAQFVAAVLKKNTLRKGK